MKKDFKNCATVLCHPVIKHYITVLRDKNTPSYLFNLAIKKISYALFFEASKNLPTETIDVQTPIVETKSEIIKQDTEIIIAPILRAGLVFQNVFQEFISNSKVYHLGMYRDEETLEPIWYYNKVKDKFKNPENTIIFILDPMLATGNSGYDAVCNFKKLGAVEKNIIFVSLISAPNGINRLIQAYPGIKIITAQLDEKLNESGYIVPGLGDAGDRIFNTGI